MSKTRIYKRDRYNSGPSIIYSHMATPTGALAIKLAEHFGVIAGLPDGCDEAGRQKLRLMTPDEVVERACAIAEKMVDRLIASDDFVDLGEPKPDPVPKPDEE